MRITNSGVPYTAAPTAPTAPAALAETAAPGAAAAGDTSGAPLQSAVMKPALAALAKMPEIDQARVSELRDAIARGELTFDAAKLAGLIQRYHGGRG